MLKLLVAVDGSESSDKAVKEVGERVDGSEQITLVTVIKEINISKKSNYKKTNTQKMNNQFFEHGTTVSPKKMEKIKEKNKLEEEGKKVLKKAEQLLQPKGVDTEKVLLTGDPSDQICQLAEEKNVDYIVLGNRGTGGIKKFLLGSTSENVLRNAKTSVCIIK